MQHVKYPDQGFSVDLFMLDSNVLDAGDEHDHSQSNICNGKYSGEHDCEAVGGPKSARECKQYFETLWHNQARWLEHKLSVSSANWQIIVTHFNCGHMSEWYKRLHEELGVDLLVTGHVHEQTLHTLPGGLTCLVSGGGGGITSERSPKGKYTNQYGFFDLTLSREHIKAGGTSLAVAFARARFSLSGRDQLPLGFPSAANLTRSHGKPCSRLRARPSSASSDSSPA